MGGAARLRRAIAGVYDYYLWMNDDTKKSIRGIGRSTYSAANTIAISQGASTQSVWLSACGDFSGSTED
jgi:hypothetical protein